MHPLEGLQYLRPLPSILGTELLLSSLFEHFLIILVRGRAIFITYGVRQKDVTRRKPPSGGEMYSPCTGGSARNAITGTRWEVLNGTNPCDRRALLAGLEWSTVRKWTAPAPQVARVSYWDLWACQRQPGARFSKIEHQKTQTGATCK